MPLHICPVFVLCSVTKERDEIFDNYLEQVSKYTLTCTHTDTHAHTDTHTHTHAQGQCMQQLLPLHLHHTVYTIVTWRVYF